MFPNQESWNPCEFCASLWQFSPFRMRLGDFFWAPPCLSEEKRWIPLKLGACCSRIPSENGGVCRFKRWKFLGLSSLWVGFIKATPKSEVFKRDSDGWAFLQKSMMRITVKDQSSHFCPFPFTFISLYCA